MIHNWISRLGKNLFDNEKVLNKKSADKGSLDLSFGSASWNERKNFSIKVAVDFLLLVR